MEIINKNRDEKLHNCACNPFVGFVTGPGRIIAGLAQAILNGLGALFLAIPTALGAFGKNSPFHAKNLARDCVQGVKHVGIGIFETLPFTSFVMKPHRGAGFYLSYMFCE